MNTESNVARLDVTPVAKLNLGSVSLRRAIIKAGFDSLPELLSLSDSKIDNLFESRAADEVIRLKDEYQTDPDRFATSVLQSQTAKNDTATNARTPLEARPSHKDPRRTITTMAARSSLHFTTDGPTSLPALPFSKSLKAYEGRAQEAFDNLDDRFQNVMAYQAFEEFPTDLDELSAAFGELFAYYSARPRDALKLIDRQLRNAFVIYVADRARNVISEGNLWGNFFTGIDGFARYDDNIKSLFKQTFVKQIERRGMPLYGRDEETNYYYYTALLHGGLSADSWSNLWEKSILPLARKLAGGNYGFGTELNGRSILKELKNPDSPLAPKKAVLNILEKAPDATIAPLFESAMSVASQVESSRGASGYTMLSSFGLPETAMEALRKSQEKTAATTVHKHAFSSKKQQERHHLIYLPMAKLQLDLAVGAVSIR